MFSLQRGPTFYSQGCTSFLPLSLAMCVELVQDAQYPYFIKCKHRVYMYPRGDITCPGEVNYLARVF